MLGEGAVLLPFVHVAEELVVALMEAGDAIDRQRRIDVRVTARFDWIGYTFEKESRVNECSASDPVPGILALVESSYLPPMMILR